MKSLIRLLLGVVLITGLVWAQEKSAPPQLKDSVALNLRTLQLELSQLQNQELQIEARERQVATQFQVSMGSALSESGIDPVKYELAQDGSLQVKEKAPVPAPAEKK